MGRSAGNASCAVIVFPRVQLRPGCCCCSDHRNARRPAPHMVWHAETILPPVDLVVVPGGFSYGDYLRAGAMAGNSPIMREVVKRAGEGSAGARHLQRFSDPHRNRPPARRLDAQCQSQICLPHRALPGRGNRQVFSPPVIVRAKWSICRSPITKAIITPMKKTLARLNGEDRVALRYANAEGAVDADRKPQWQCREYCRHFQRRRATYSA